MYLDWGGTPAASHSVNDKQCLRAFLQNLPTLDQPFYIHPFLYSIDGTTLGGSSGAGVGRNVKEAVAVLQSRKSAEVGRIQKFV